MALPSLIDVEVRYVGADFEPVVTTLASVDVESVVRGRPVRRVRSSVGQRHYSGLYWSTTTRSHLGYESRLELDRLVLADFDRDVDWIATQPMWLSGRDESTSRRHVPDLLLKQRGGRYLLVDVKPAEFAGRAVRPHSGDQRMMDRDGADPSSRSAFPSGRPPGQGRSPGRQLERPAPPAGRAATAPWPGR